MLDTMNQKLCREYAFMRLACPEDVMYKTEDGTPCMDVLDPVRMTSAHVDTTTKTDKKKVGPKKRETPSPGVAKAKIKATSGDVDDDAEYSVANMLKKPGRGRGRGRGAH